jgi:hypothetical protein
MVLISNTFKHVNQKLLNSPVEVSTEVAVEPDPKAEKQDLLFCGRKASLLDLPDVLKQTIVEFLLPSKNYAAESSENGSIFRLTETLEFEYLAYNNEAVSSILQEVYGDISLLKKSARETLETLLEETSSEASAKLTVRETISSIELHDLLLTPELLKKLFFFFPNLRALSFTGCKLTTESIELIANLPLEKLLLPKCFEIHDDALEQISRITTLQVLDISVSDHVTDEGVATLKTLVHLQQLNLSGCGAITNNSLHAFENCPSLKILNLSRCIKLTDSGLEILSQFKELQVLDISRCPHITASGIQHLPHLKNLVSLNISHSVTDFVNESVEEQVEEQVEEPIEGQIEQEPAGDANENSALLAICQISTLQKLDISYLEFSNDALASLSLLTKLEEITLYNFDFDENTAKALLPLKNHLKVLKTSFQASDSSLKILSSFTALRELELSYLDDVTENGLQSLSALSQLEKLFLTHSGNTLLGREAFKFLEELTKLKELYLHNFGPTLSQGLSYIPKSSALTLLSLDESEITDEALKTISKLCNLENLSLKCCRRITHIGLGFIKNLRLEVLTCTDTKLTDKALESVGVMKSLRVLQLDECWKITDLGIAHLGGLDRLSELSISHTQITDASGKTLQKLKRLHALSVASTEFGDNGLQDICSLKRLKKFILTDCETLTDACAISIAKLRSLSFLDISDNDAINDRTRASLEALKKTATHSLSQIVN